MSSHSHTKPTQRSNRKPRNLPRIVRPRCPRGQTPTSTTPGETRQGGVKRSGTIAPRSHQLPLNGNFRTEEREKPTHLKEKPNKNCLVCTTQPKDDSSLAGLFRETGGVVGTTPARTGPCARDPPPLQMAFLPPRRVNLDFFFDFCLSTSIPVLTTSTYVVAWPQGDQFLGGGM